MKILVISHTYIAPINREKWKVFAKLYSDFQIKVLIPKIWPANLFTIHSGDLSSDNDQNCEFVALNTFKNGNEVLYGYKFFELIKLLKEFKPDLIHVEQGDSAFSYFQSIFLSKIFCPKAKFTFFTWVNWEEKRSWKYKFFWKFIERFNLFFTNGAFVGNQDAKKILQDKNFKKPIEVLHQLGVNKKFFYPAKHENKSKKKYIGYIGRLIKEKGIFTLIDAFVLIKKKFCNWNLLIVGDGKDKKDFVNYVCKKKLMDRIEFRPPVCHEEVVSIFHQIEIFVLPSYDIEKWREQFGHVLIEAMSCKVPVIGSTGGYIPNVIGDAGLIFEQKNEKKLAKCLNIFMRDEKIRKTFGQKGYSRFELNFSYNIIAKKTFSFWNKLC
ncbi:glycosyltransferase family 4 protein [Candidatus Babeliales bacterium]|nr:glycosyltransferase family 4 protein [Candidatus Babeliales bacterium]